MHTCWEENKNVAKNIKVIMPVSYKVYVFTEVLNVARLRNTV